MAEQLALEPSAARADLEPQDLDQAWHESLTSVMREVVTNLPDSTTLGELIGATQANAHLEPVLTRMTVQELIDMARARKAPSETRKRDVELDEEGNPLLDLPDTGAAVIRRRADVPDGDVLVLKALVEHGPMSESTLTRKTRVTSEQLRLTLRQLRTKGYIHIEGSGTKRKLRITRNGSSFLRKKR